MSSLKLKLRALYATFAATVQSRARIGHNIYDDDWDALIILDACRVDALREVEDEYKFITDIESRWSLGSTSKEWLENTFTREYITEINDTAYITSNYYAGKFDDDSRSRIEYPIARHETVGETTASKVMPDDVVSSEDFCEFIPLFDKHVSENQKQLHPKDVTDHVINVTRQSGCDRFLIHYMQPHHPFLHDDSSDPWNDAPFSYLNDGGDFEKVWRGYLENLRLVLDQVELLLKNLDSKKVIITADHGELFGEWGLYSHGVGIPHPKLRKVPWVETTARDKGSHNPDSVVSDETVSDEVVEDRLDALGYA